MNGRTGHGGDESKDYVVGATARVARRSVQNMSGYKEKGFADRLSASARAKAATVEHFKAQPAPDDPTVLERQARSRAVAEAREQRATARRLAREADLARIAEHEARRAAEELARELEAAQRETELEAERKAARDARYAARKKRK